MTRPVSTLPSNCCGGNYRSHALFPLLLPPGKTGRSLYRKVTVQWRFMLASRLWIRRGTCVKQASRLMVLKQRGNGGRKIHLDRATTNGSQKSKRAVGDPTD